jgi:hypothetical protein
MTLAASAAAFAGCALTLGVIAWASPLPDRVTDRDVYEATAADGIVRDCTDLHCFRVLVPWTLAVLPGASIVKWKAYAVLSNAAAALAVWHLCSAFAMSVRVRWVAAAFSLFGFGSLYTLHDVYTADPLMYFLGPAVTYQLLRERIAIAGAIASVTVLAKEFVAAPLAIYSVFSLIERRYASAVRALIAFNCAFMVWLALQLTLMLRFNYGYGDNPSTHLLSGGYARHWFEQQSVRGALSALFNEFGAVYILAAAGVFMAPPRLRRLALCALPVALLFGYVQQPDRALWNFHFLATPLAAVALDKAPVALAWGTVAAFAIVNLRIGAQLTAVPAARFAMLVSVVLAVAALFFAMRPRVAASHVPA